MPRPLSLRSRRNDARLVNARPLFAPSNGRRLLAILGGVMLAVSFPKLSIAGLAWVAPGIFLAAALGTDGRTAFTIGFLGGLAHHLISLSWLLNIPVMKLAPITGWIALSTYCALYQALWVWLCWRVFPGSFSNPAAVNAPALGGLLDRFLAPGWFARAGWTFTCAALWVAGEMVQVRFLSGFPWNFLGTSQFKMLPVIQVASATGVYGVSFLVAWFAVALLCAFVVVLRQSQSPRRCLGELILPFAAIFAVVALGFPRLTQSPVPKKHLTAALIQPSIPQRMIWSPEENAKRFEQLLELSNRALTNRSVRGERATLLVWPEAAVPGYVRFDTNLHHAITNLIARHGVWMILGADDAAPRRDSDDPFAHDNFNASFLLSPDGEFRASYRKRRLVMFGEYLPFARWLPFLERWTGMGSFTPGDGPVPFRAIDPAFKTSVLICFEDTFPHAVRDDVGDDTDFLLNLTNNGWFGESAAQWQHAANAVFRAVENGLPLVRCANNGLTCVVSARGHVSHTFFPGTIDAYGPGFKIVEVPLLDGARHEATTYRRHGDVFGWACVVWSALAVGFALRRRETKLE